MVQDDARQHVFWMQRFLDPGVFPNDFTADYFQSVAPWGYAWLYRGGAALGIDPWIFNKILPVFIAGIATVLAFATVMALVPVPIAAFISTVFLNQALILRDDVVSATPVAFLYPCFLAFIYFAVQRFWLPCVFSIVLLGGFYPQGVLVAGGTLSLMGLSLLRWRKGRLILAGTRADYWLVGSGLVAAFLVLLPHALENSAYGPILTLAEARSMVTLSAQGWSDFFIDDPVEFWLFGQRTGLFPARWQTLDLKVQPQIWLTLAIPFLVMWPRTSRLAQQVRPRVAILLQIAIASVICYSLAYLMLFELHLPNRYTEHSFRLIAAIGSGVAVALIMERWRPVPKRRAGKWLALILLGIWAIAPLVEMQLSLASGSTQFEDSQGNYYRGKFPDLYAYLQSQPQTTVVASLDEEINNLPAFTNRSIFVGGKGYALPYHLGYYDEVKQRSLALITAQYSFDAAVVKDFLDTYAIDIWMVQPAMFTPEWVNQSQWLFQYSQDIDIPQLATAVAQPTVVERWADVCQTATLDSFVLIDTKCLQSQL